MGLSRRRPYAPILSYIERLPVGTPNGHLNERCLRPVARLSLEEQLAAVSRRLGRRFAQAAAPA
jgi:hypothetical protein